MKYSERFKRLDCSLYFMLADDFFWTEYCTLKCIQDSGENLVLLKPECYCQDMMLGACSKRPATWIKAIWWIKAHAEMSVGMNLACTDYCLLKEFLSTLRKLKCYHKIKSQNHLCWRVLQAKLLILHSLNQKQVWNGLLVW